jgi:hypothetical protein
MLRTPKKLKLILMSTIRERLVRALELAGGKLPLGELLFDYRLSRDQLDDIVESAHSPIRIQIHYNGQPRPVILVALKDYTPPEPVSQEQALERLNAMSGEEFYSLLDPTYRLRHKRRAGGGARTSTGADEYLVNRDNIR